MGLYIDVYRNSSRPDASNDGISNQFSRLCVVNVDGVFEPTENIPAVKLVPGHCNGGVHLVLDDGVGKWLTFGGNFGYTSDSRFSNAIKKITGAHFYGAVAIHDKEG